MDRRDNPETPGSHTDDQFQKAFDVIALSYRGEDPERLYREATRCFDSLIEISYGNEAIKEFAHRRSIDIKYLVDGASFVISKMHFNPEGNYYVTLGLPQNVSQEELSRRWKRLMLLYHPDRQGGNEEWVSERAKKVNEAYTILKDETRRAEYDHRLREKQGNQMGKAAASHGYPHRPQRSFPGRSRNSVPPSGAGNLRRYMPKILIGVYALIAAVVLGLIYMQNRSSQLETELARRPAEIRNNESQQPSPVTSASPVKAEKDAPNTSAASQQEIKKETVRKEEKKAATTSPLQIARRWFHPKEQKQAGGQQTAEKGVEITPEKKESIVQEGSIPFPAPVRPSSSGELRQQESREDRPPRHADPVMIQPGQKQAYQQDAPKALQELKQQVVPQQKPETITREEVEEFMQRYIRAYTRNDLNAFMSLFSHSAVENNSMNYSEIRNAYRETFSEKINHYTIQNMDIKTGGQSASVSGIYNINRYISSEDRWVKYSGRIAWKLIRENNQIRIISTTYDK